MTWGERLRGKKGAVGQWLKRLPGQLVLSHVFVAVVVLAFAFGVAQVTFRQYLVRSQIEQLTSQVQTITQLFRNTGTLNSSQVIFMLKVLQGTLNDRIMVVDDTGEPILYTTEANFPQVRIPYAGLVRVLEQGKTYHHIVEGDIAVVGTPLAIEPHNIAYGIFVESPLSLTNRTAASLTRLLLFGELAAVVLVGALAYAISWRLAKPLEQLRQIVAGARQSDDGVMARAPEFEGPLEVQTLATEFNHLQDRIEGQMSELKQEAEARDALMAHVAHDLRTPLTSIRGFLEAVKDGVATGHELDRSVQIAWEETLRLQRLVNRLLRATRIRSEEVHMGPLSIVDVVRKTVDRINPVLEQKRLTLVWDERQDETIWGNEDYLMEALLNLIDNAVKWSPAHGTITIATKRQDSQVLVRVMDEGPGIPKELLPRAFERFVTGDASRQQSSGLGLFIVEEVAHQHHGWVRLESKEGQGTMVELKLPIFNESGADGEGLHD